MVGPFHKTCNCRCLPPFPCIEGCAKSGNFQYNTILLNMVSPTYTYTTASDTFTHIEGTAVANVYNPDVTAIGASKTLKRRPNSSAFGYGQKVGSSDCQWLWNNPLAVSDVLLSPNFCGCFGESTPGCVSAFVTTPAAYIPVNAIDSTSPWDRVIPPNSDYRCGTCYCTGCGSILANPRGHYVCKDLIYYSSGVLYIAESGVTYGAAPYSGYWYWVFDFKATGAFSWSYNRIQHPNYPYEGYQEIHNAGLVQQNFSGRVVGGCALDGGHPTAVTLRYAKRINCDTDFEGTPVTIPFHQYLDQVGIYTYTMATYPSSVSIELTA